jgi:hypothetical protein
VPEGEERSVRRHVIFGWITGFLIALLIPHAIVGAIRHWPPGLVSVHGAITVLAGFAAFITWAVAELDRRTQLRVLAEELERIEQRLDPRT